jgi:hypothetical protein
MAKKAKRVAKARQKAKAKPKAKAAKVAKSKKTGSKKTSPAIKAKGIAYAAPPKDTITRPKSVTIPLAKEEAQETSYSTIPSFAPSIPAPVASSTTSSTSELGRIAKTSSGIHSFGAVVFLLLAVVGYWFSLVFVSKSQWLSFLFSLAVMIICLDSFMATMLRREEAKHPLSQPGMQNMHQLMMHLFLLLAIIAAVFALSFWLQGRWIMLLVALGAAVVAVDNMLLAKKKHETH